MLVLKYFYKNFNTVFDIKEALGICERENSSFPYPHNFRLSKYLQHFKSNLDSRHGYTVFERKSLLTC